MHSEKNNERNVNKNVIIIIIIIIVVNEIHLTATGIRMSMGSHGITRHQTEATSPPSSQPKLAGYSIYLLVKDERLSCPELCLPEK